jgi:hypothetical protein
MPIYQQGMNQQTPAVQNTLRTLGGTIRRGVRRAAKRAASSVKRAVKKRARRKLKFGSPAWRKKYMKKR